MTDARQVDTDDIRSTYAAPGEHPGDWVKYQARREAEFDQWLAAVKADAWDEGYRRGNLDGYFGTMDEWKKVHPDD